MTSVAPLLDQYIPTPRAPLPTAVEEFLSSMPASYHAQFDETDARDHAAIVWRRDRALAHIEQWIAPGEDAVWLCVVTDDRPGLLASLSAAITAHSLNILDAKIYCRTAADGQREAVDFFRVLPVKVGGPPSLDAAELAMLGSTLVGVLRGKIDLRTLRNRAVPTWRPSTRPETTVYFEGESDDADHLMVETDDQPGLLASITNALFKANVSIVWSNVATIAGRVRDEFHLRDRDGERLTELRKDAVVAHVVAALDLLEPNRSQPSHADVIDNLQDDLDGCRPSRMLEPMPGSGLHRISKPPSSF
jgi:UTP:GlnB (protein PII) uridylyltransferase